MRRDLCEPAKRGKLCCDDLCHGNPDDTLCGFNQSFYEEISEEYESDRYEDDDCMDCGMCDSCIERTKALVGTTAKDNSSMANAPIDVSAAIDKLAATVFERMEERAEMLRALKAWEHWYGEDSTEFNRDTAREMGLRAIARVEGE